MACPHCGGTDGRAISPGFWECTSLLYGEIPTGLHPSGKFGPAFQTVAHPCGRRYQEGAPGGTGTLCQTCTVFAIGICADCGKPQCGTCGRHEQGAFLCAQCRQARAAVERAAAAELAAKAARMKAAAEASVARQADARRTWLREVAGILGAQVRPTYREGWAVGPATGQSVQSEAAAYRGYSSTSWEESQLIVTSTGQLLYHMRRKPKQTSWRWAHNWTVPYVLHDALDLSAIAAYIRTQHGVSVPKFDAPS
jgi:hypothetical protein